MYMDAKKGLDYCQWSLWTPEWKEIDWKGTGCTWHCVCVCVCVCLSVCAHVCMHVHTHLVALSWVVVAPTLCDPMDCSPPGSFVHGISQAKMLEWVTILFSRGSNLDLWHCRWIFLPSEPQYSTVRCEDVILVTVCSYLEKVAGGTGMGLMISDHDRRAFYPLFISFSRVTDVHYNRHWALEFQQDIW